MTLSRQALSDLDTLAEEFINAFNAQHQAGFDFNGAAGGNSSTLWSRAHPLHHR